MSRVLMFKHRNTEFYIFFWNSVSRACIQCREASIQRIESEPENSANVCYWITQILVEYNWIELKHQ